jgi:PAS domain S-box-containing protein
MRDWRLFFHVSLGVIIAALSITLFFTITSHEDANEGAYSGFQQNITWHATQTESELLVALSALAELRRDPSSANRQEFVTRFDIFWSRLHNLLEGDAYKAVRELHNGRAVIERSIAAIKRIEPLVVDQSANAPSGYAEAYRVLHALRLPLHELALQSVHIHNQQSTELARHVVNEHRTILFVFVGVLLLGVGFIAYLLIARRGYQRLHDSLERRVADRTRELDQAITALRANEVQLNMALEFAQISVWSWVVGEKTLYVDEYSYKMMGIPPSAVAPTPSDFIAAVHDDDRRFVRNTLRRAMLSGTGYDIEFRLDRMDGGRRVIASRGQVVCDIEGRAERLLGVCWDITDRIEAEEALRESEHRLREAQHIGRLGHWERRLTDGRYRWSDEIYTLLGQQVEDGLIDAQKLQALLHEDDASKIDWVQSRAIASGGVESVDFRVQRSDGAWRWFHAEAIARFGANGRPERVVGTFQDVTEQVAQREQQAELQRQLQHAQRMESIGQLTGGIAHDFNNMLAIMTGYVELARLLDPVTERDDFETNLDKVLKTATRASELIGQMLTFSRDTGAISLEPLDLHQLVSDAVKLLQPTFSAALAVTVEIADDLPPALADKVQLQQVLLNLCINARDAAGANGHILIGAERVVVTDLVCSSCHSPVTGQFLQLEVSDTGPGVSEEMRERVFEPFFSTKEAGKGTGMGLSIVHGILHRHHGHVVLDRSPEGGARFRLLLHEADTAVRDAADNQEATIGGGQSLAGYHIAIIDDESDLLNLMANFLKRSGAEISTFDDSEAALQKLTSTAQSKPIDLIITDQIMPRLTGIELAERLNAAGSEVPVIICTGFSQAIGDERLAAAGVYDVLNKPVGMQLLLARIIAIMNQVADQPVSRTVV